MANTKFKRGAKPTPRHKLQAAMPHILTPGTPTQFAVVPTQLSYWDNNVDGDCVTAEEAYAKAAYSIMGGDPELFVPDQEVIDWATKYGYLNGADLTDVMTTMASDGFTVGGTNYKDGPYTGVDYSNEPVLQNAISLGPVKIGIDADALPDGAGNGNGWYSNQTGTFNNEDHCVALTGFGPASFLYQQLNMRVPSGLDPTTPGYLLFTWSSIGFVTHGWIMSTCAEAWLRNPTTAGAPTPTPSPPSPPSPPTPEQVTLAFSDFPLSGEFRLIGGQTQTVKVSGSGNVTMTLPTTSGPSTSMLATLVGDKRLKSMNWQQWLALITAILTEINNIINGGGPTDVQTVSAKIATAIPPVGSLTPQQWLELITEILTAILPLILGS